MKTAEETLIFLVDDDQIFQIMLSEYLKEKFNYKVEIYGSGEECLNELRKEPDVVLLDYNLFASNGLETLKKIKEINADIQVLSVSGQTNLNTTMEIMQNGAFSYIVKDESTFEVIGVKIREMLDTAQVRKNERNEIVGVMALVASLILIIGYEVFTKLF